MEKSASSELVPQEWDIGLSKSRILNLFEIPFFGKIPHEKMCANILFSQFHGGNLCLNRAISIYTKLIETINGIPATGEDISLLFY